MSSSFGSFLSVGHRAVGGISAANLVDLAVGRLKGAGDGSIGRPTRPKLAMIWPHSLPCLEEFHCFGVDLSQKCDKESTLY